MSTLASSDSTATGVPATSTRAGSKATANRSICGGVPAWVEAGRRENTRWPVTDKRGRSAFFSRVRCFPLTNAAILPAALEPAWKIVPVPPGSATGQVMPFSPGSRASRGTRTSGTPPAAGTRRTGPLESPNTMMPSAVHVPCPMPRGRPATSATTTGPPPASAIFFNFCSAGDVKATNAPSGEKNGAIAPSVPGRPLAEASVRRRWYNRGTLPSGPGGPSSATAA